MYFFNIDGLKQQLASHGLSQAQALGYLLALTLLWYLPIGVMGDGLTVWDTASFWASLLITVVGTFAAYKANGGNHGKQFLERFLSLSWVIFWRVLPMAFLLGWIAVILRTMAYGDAYYQLTEFGFAFSVVVEFIYYQRIHAHLQQLTGIKTTRNFANA